MKIKNIIYLFLSIITTVNLHKVEAINKMVPRIVEVRGSLPRKHTVVKTIINHNPKQIEENGVKTTIENSIITRSVIGEPLVYIADKPRNSKTSVYTDVTLKVPEKEIEFKSDIPDMIAKMAGAIPDPNVGMAVSAAAALVDASLEIAGNELTKKYGIDPCTIQMIEILPNQYYRIDTGTGKVQTTEYFNRDLEEYTKLIEKYIPAAEEYNKALQPYNKAIRQWVISDPLKQNTAKIKELRNMFEKTVKPALHARLEIENELTKYTLYRYAIMAVNSTPGTSCEEVNCKGPWQIFVYFFIGAKQTNVFEINYCVPDPDKTQNFIVELVPNKFDSNGNFQIGGLRFVAAKSDSNIYFPKQSGTEKVNMRSLESRWLKWNEEMLIDENADVPGVYLFPFDIYKLKDAYEKHVQEKKDAHSKERLEKLDTAIKEFKEKYPEYKKEKEEAAEKKVEQAREEKDESETIEKETTTGTKEEKLTPEENAKKEAEEKANAEKAAKIEAAKKAGAETTATREKARKEAEEKAKTEKGESLGLETLFGEQ
jgi:hypothetical protein